VLYCIKYNLKSIWILQGKKKVVGKKVAAPPPLAAKKSESKRRQNPLFEKRPRNFGIGQDIQPTRDLSRFVKWPRYIRVQRQKQVLQQRLKVPPPINQFSQTLDRQTGTTPPPWYIALCSDSGHRTRLKVTMTVPWERYIALCSDSGHNDQNKSQWQCLEIGKKNKLTLCCCRGGLYLRVYFLKVDKSSQRVCMWESLAQLSIFMFQPSNCSEFWTSTGQKPVLKGKLD